MEAEAEAGSDAASVRLLELEPVVLVQGGCLLVWVLVKLLMLERLFFFLRGSVNIVLMRR